MEEDTDTLSQHVTRGLVQHARADVSNGADAAEELVFGLLEEEEVFMTPLAASRSTSDAGDVVPAVQDVSSAQQPASHASEAAVDADAVASALAKMQWQEARQPVSRQAGDAAVLSKAAGATTAPVTAEFADLQNGSGTASGFSAAVATSPAPTTSTNSAGQLDVPAQPSLAANGSHQPPQLVSAAVPAHAMQRQRQQRQASLPEPQFWREGSALVTFGVPGQQQSQSGTGSDHGSDSDSASECSWAANEYAAGDTAGTVSTASSATADAAGANPPFVVPTVADPAPCTLSSPASVSVTSRSQQSQHHHQQQPRSPVSLASLGSLGSPRAVGLERTASWQLQHAAAAAAGTAAHPAPPRSDLQLTRLSSSPASPHGEDAWAAWQRRRRHFFVLTAAGKPVFSLHGDEQALAGFMAVVQALVSVIADQGDSIQSITVGPTQLVFLLKGQLYLAAVSSRGEAPAALRRQLELLYQTILMFVTGGIEKMLQRSPGYDVQQLLAGSKSSMRALISSFGDCPGWMMGTVEPAAAAPADRQAAAAALQDAVKASDALYGILLVGCQVLGAETGKGPPPLNVYDLLLLANFTNSSESLRHSETFVPVCLPNFQPNAFLHAYIANLEPQQQQQQQQASQQQPQQTQQQHHSGRHMHHNDSNNIFLLLLSGSADSFHKLSAAKQQLSAALVQGLGGGVLGRVLAAATAGGARGRVETLPAPLGGSFGTTPLWHAVVRYPQRRQHITLNYPQELFTHRKQRKQLVRSYCRLFAAAYAPLLEAATHGSKSSSGAGPGVTSQPGGPRSGSGPAGGTSSATSAASSIASIVGAGSVGSGAAAAAAAAAAYVLPYATGQPRSNRLVWVTTNRWVTGVIVDRDVEVYVTFDPLTEKEVGLKLVEQLRRHYGDKTLQQELLVPGL